MIPTGDFLSHRYDLFDPQKWSTREEIGWITLGPEPVVVHVLLQCHLMRSGDGSGLLFQRLLLVLSRTYRKHAEFTRCDI
jgi:hypothetical protein